MEENINIQTGNIVNSAGVLNFRSQLTNVNNSIEAIQANSSDSKAKDLARLCNELKITLENEAQLSLEEKTELLEQINKILKAAQYPNNKSTYDKGKRALASLKGLLSVMPVLSSAKGIIESIGIFFGL